MQSRKTGSLCRGKNSMEKEAQVKESQPNTGQVDWQYSPWPCLLSKYCWPNGEMGEVEWVIDVAQLNPRNTFLPSSQTSLAHMQWSQETVNREMQLLPFAEFCRILQAFAEFCPIMSEVLQRRAHKSDLRRHELYFRAGWEGTCIKQIRVAAAQSGCFPHSHLKPRHFWGSSSSRTRWSHQVTVTVQILTPICTRPLCWPTFKGLHGYPGGWACRKSMSQAHLLKLSS